MRLVIFDCDGVLVNSEDLAEESLQETYAESGIDLPLEEIRGLFTGLAYEDYLLTREDVYRRHTGQALPAAFEGRLHDIFNRKALARLTAIEGIPELLQALEDAGVPFCVASNSGRTGLRLKLETTGLYDHFHPHVYSRQDVARGKPAPDVFLHAARETGNVDPGDCIVVEDSGPGARAGVAAGMHVIGFARHGQVQADRLLAAGVHDIVTTGNELKTRIFQLLGLAVPAPRPAPQP